ncbi:beta-lactamase family protein [Nonomuraea sp. KC401]|uniref:serine hydrolase domain-containing protein n=1 Tax=unclassified Nonomuraea TaxID=2593643 RepID=UPI0010FD25B6|nr:MULTISPECIES: serine hydrolase domain-containing protein [unclassified Nonomuraea]NBE99588.1 serine hydrolase [Nonomuraea sp. K271]TLF56819.1 beta-lactamase family protein [Nonomuraea sp. KC401]
MSPRGRGEWRNAMGEIQEQVQRHIDTLVATGAETGVQVAVHHDGALIVDAVAGTADPATGRPVTSGTPIFSFSTGKNVAATLAHLLVARGYLRYDSPVTDLWPEFGVRGKASATLRHVLTHTAGLPAMPREITPAELPDWSRVCESLAAAEARWRPGGAVGYHSYTFGYLVGELARRATGRTMGELLREWITTPLGIEGQLYFGAPKESLPGLARLEQQARQWPAGPDDGDAILAPWESRPSADVGNDSEILRADIPSAGIATAHGLAAMFNAVLRGKLVDSARLAQLSALAFESTDQVFGTPARMALGFPIGRMDAPAVENSVALGWPGGGGSYPYATIARRKSCPLPGRRLDRAADQPRSVLLTGRPPTPWEATERALRRIQKFQLCTVRRDGRTHVTPLPAIGAPGAMWFTTGDNEQQAMNLGANPHCAPTTGTDAQPGKAFAFATGSQSSQTRCQWR